MPICRDLLLLYKGLGHQLAPARRVGEVRKVLSKRLRDGLFVNKDNDSRVSLRSTIFNEKHLAGKAYRHYLKLDVRLYGTLQHVAQQLSVAVDTLIISLIALACARTDLTDRVSLTLFVPMRDGRDEQGMIGLMADWRTVVFHFPRYAPSGEGLSVVSAVTYVNEKIKNREWEVFDIPSNPDMSLLNVNAMESVSNVLPRTVPSRGYENIRPTAIGQSSFSASSWKTDNREKDESANRGRSFALEQQDSGLDQWDICVECSPDVYDPFWVRELAVQFQRSVDDVVDFPLAYVHERLEDDAFWKYACDLGMLPPGNVLKKDSSKDSSQSEPLKVGLGEVRGPAWRDQGPREKRTREFWSTSNTKWRRDNE